VLRREPVVDRHHDAVGEMGDLAALAIAHVEAPEHEAAAVEVDARGRRL
jgi:hypothetical protein